MCICKGTLNTVFSHIIYLYYGDAKNTKYAPNLTVQVCLSILIFGIV